jgi:tRNA G46 methylase TrmB
MANKYPQQQFYGMEKDATIVLKLLRKLHRQENIPKNLHIICDDAKNLSLWFQNLQEIHLQFPDP